MASTDQISSHAPRLSIGPAQQFLSNSMDHSRSASEVGESGPPPKRQRLKAPRRGRPSGGRGGSRSGSSAPTVADGAQEDSADPPRDEIAVATAPAYDVRNEPISVSLERFRAWRSKSPSFRQFRSCIC